MSCQMADLTEKGNEPESPAPQDAAKGLLQGHLSSMGFTSGQVNAALEDLADARNSSDSQAEQVSSSPQLFRLVLFSVCL